MRKSRIFVAMNRQLIFRRAVEADMERILQIIAQAQRQMREAGSLQWQNGYPARRDIDADLRRGCGYVLQRPDMEEPQAVIAYGAVIFDGEAAYRDIEGAWLGEQAYVVLHRLAVADGEKCRGVATEFFHRTVRLARERGIGSFRVDTNFDNHRMLHILRREGFVYCGKVHYESGERLAFEKPLGVPQRIEQG